MELVPIGCRWGGEDPALLMSSVHGMFFLFVLYDDFLVDASTVMSVGREEWSDGHWCLCDGTCCTFDGLECDCSLC